MTLPPEFTGVYRLFLRACSASVLHHGPSKRSLQRLYRPSFDAAAGVARQLQGLDNSSQEATRLRNGLADFDNRVNETLSFLLTAARSRGLPHRVVKNLTYLERTHTEWVLRHASHPKRIWNPQLPKDSPEYSVRPPTLYSPHAQKNTAKRTTEIEFRKKMWGAVGEAIRMSQGRDGLMFGKVQFKRQMFEGMIR